MKYEDIRAKKLIQIAANSLPQNPEKAKTILRAVLANSTVDIFGGDIYEYLDGKEEKNTPQENSEELMEEAVDEKSISEPEESKPIPEDEPGTAHGEAAVDSGSDLVDFEAGSNQERLLDSGDRNRLLEAAIAARYKGKIGLAHQIELSLSSDLVSTIQSIFMNEVHLFDTRIAYLHLGMEPASLEAVSKMQTMLLQVGAEPTINRLALQPLSENSLDGFALREQAIVCQLQAMYEDLLSKLDISNPIESELYLVTKDLQSYHQCDKG